MKANRYIKAVLLNCKDIMPDYLLSELQRIAVSTNIAIIVNGEYDNKSQYTGLIFVADYQYIHLNKETVCSLLRLDAKQILEIRQLLKVQKFIKNSTQALFEREVNYRTLAYRKLLCKANDLAKLGIEGFIKKAQIKVSLSYDNHCHLENIYQLFRQSKNKYVSNIENRKQLIDLLDNKEMVSASIFATSNYGNYGLVGFISFQRTNRLITNFVVEDVHEELDIRYTILRYFALNLQMEQLKKMNHIEFETIPYAPQVIDEVFFKGPCDVRSIWEQFANLCTETEFTYTNKQGISIESVNHFRQICEARELSDIQIDFITSEIPFLDKHAFSKKIYNKKFDTIVMSVLTDANLGVYEKNDGSYRVVFGEKRHRLTKRNMSKWLSREYEASKFQFSEEFYMWFVNNFHYVGATSARQLIKYLSNIRKKINPDTRIVIIGGVEKKYRKCKNDNYHGRFALHWLYRLYMQCKLKSIDNFKVFSINDYIFSQNDFRGHYNHFQRNVYYNLALDLVDYIDPNNEKGFEIRLY